MAVAINCNQRSTISLAGCVKVHIANNVEEREMIFGARSLQVLAELWSRSPRAADEATSTMRKLE